ncbi:hypothetical protein GGS23DRAFT_272406 [Durotheca rogersii]|uniref:uncharacterized protein n=1 Tax=Durotheca rogersii TaxID=419775 RepID=UPI0022207CD1|nr:uncharacterized protein GGS23DRAFT_272406 [Durotheca rogersii]KAI5866453.1 hypothetical protein GGS23DRAFT_272406 [Durotheca rogersii]
MPILHTSIHAPVDSLSVRRVGREAKGADLQPGFALAAGEARILLSPPQGQEVRAHPGTDRSDASNEAVSPPQENGSLPPDPAIDRRRASREGDGADAAAKANKGEKRRRGGETPTPTGTHTSSIATACSLQGRPPALDVQAVTRGPTRVSRGALGDQPRARLGRARPRSARTPPTACGHACWPPRVYGAVAPRPNTRRPTAARSRGMRVSWAFCCFPRAEYVPSRDKMDTMRVM